MPLQIWILLIPAAVLLLCGIYTRRRRRRWPSFSVGLIFCDAFFLLCMLVVNAQITRLAQAKTDAMNDVLYSASAGHFIKAIVRGSLELSTCSDAYLWLRTIMIVFLLATVISLVAECSRIFSAPPELIAEQKKLSEQEERLRRRTYFPIQRSKERKPESDERENKL